MEHVFGAQSNDMGGTLVRGIGLVRAKARIGLKNLAYNMRRLAVGAPRGGGATVTVFGQESVQATSFGIKSTAQERPNAKIPRPGDVSAPSTLICA